MAAPLRKPRKPAASQSSGEKRRFVIRLSGPMVALLGAILAVAVGWSFFMGFMVGRGQNPETRVEQMTNLISKDERKAKPAAPTPGAPDAPDVAAQTETADAQNQAPGAAGAAGAAGTEGTQASGAAAPQGKAGQDQQGQKAAQAQQGKQGQQPPPGAYPFAQPSGNSLAAWGIKPGGNQNAQGQNAQASTQSGAQNGTQTAKPAPAKTGPQFDYVFQVAAFKSDEDADKLRTRLEGKGLRTRTQKSGKLVLVMVSIRGTEDDAFNLREDLRHMKLGVPIQVSQKPVSSKPQKSGR